MRVVVAGATGHTGRRAVSRLLSAGDDVRALCRSPERAQQILGDHPRLELFAGDVRHADSLTDLGRNADALVLATGTRSYWGDNGGAAVDAVGTENVLRAVSNGDVSRVVQVSAFGLDRTSPWLSLFSAGLNRYFHWKRLAEQAVRSSGLDYYILRPVELRERPPRPGALLNQSAPLSLLRTMSRDLLADVVVECVRSTHPARATFELCEGGRASIAEQLPRMHSDATRPLPTRTPLW